MALKHYFWIKTVSGIVIGGMPCLFEMKQSIIA